MPNVRRMVVTVAFVVMMVLVAAGPALAVMDRNDTPCTASGTITDKTGKVVTQADQDATLIKVPREGKVSYQGGVGKLARSYSGRISLDFDVIKCTPSAWKFGGGPQKDGHNRAAGDRAGPRDSPRRVGAARSRPRREPACRVSGQVSRSAISFRAFGSRDPTMI